ncbi:S-adenosylmethionine-dependent methyltransferase, class I [Giardia muris]|uniref:S-adenosylmethionine-dependent methyltransferase, class I n=1 Tax=Giardia muris TaxID=5742 RepID=A0A4Z1T6F5_GIAMU|nr:S-adenosylmethionine-dependent methyltransferase, class I [Giardia muris]|eukprot:TNJ29643.1 S-adenosylmethionine-dependent methyltransferase, class I [Giardia muris]
MELADEVLEELARKAEKEGTNPSTNERVGFCLTFAEAMTLLSLFRPGSKVLASSNNKAYLLYTLLIDLWLRGVIRFAVVHRGRIVALDALNQTQTRLLDELRQYSGKQLSQGLVMQVISREGLTSIETRLLTNMMDDMFVPQYQGGYVSVWGIFDRSTRLQWLIPIMNTYELSILDGLTQKRLLVSKVRFGLFNTRTLSDTAFRSMHYISLLIQMLFQSNHSSQPKQPIEAEFDDLRSDLCDRIALFGSTGLICTHVEIPKSYQLSRDTIHSFRKRKETLAGAMADMLTNYSLKLQPENADSRDVTISALIAIAADLGTAIV